MEKLRSFVKGHRLQVVKAVLILLSCVLIFGLYQSVSYSWPMYGHKYRKAYKSLCADKPTVLYDAALAAYQSGAYEAAKEMLVKAHSRCLDSSGRIPESRRQLASSIQFLLGNTLVKMKMVKPAIEAYKESLRLEPSNLYAKYNLELLQSQNSGSGEGSGNPGGGNNGGKKGI